MNASKFESLCREFPELAEVMETTTVPGTQLSDCESIRVARLDERDLRWTPQVERYQIESTKIDQAETVTVVMKDGGLIFDAVVQSRLFRCRGQSLIAGISDVVGASCAHLIDRVLITKQGMEVINDRSTRTFTITILKIGQFDLAKAVRQQDEAVCRERRLTELYGEDA